MLLFFELKVCQKVFVAFDIFGYPSDIPVFCFQDFGYQVRGFFFGEWNFHLFVFERSENQFLIAENSVVVQREVLSACKKYRIFAESFFESHQEIFGYFAIRAWADYPITDSIDCVYSSDYSARVPGDFQAGATWEG